MKEIILIKNGEIALKGLNRGGFEDLLIRNIKRRVAPLGAFSVWKAQSTIYLEPQTPEIDLNEALARLEKVFGIATISRALVVPKDLNAVMQLCPAYLRETLEAASTFKVEAKRADKQFALTSPEIAREVGGRLLDAFPHLRVDVKNPEITVTVEIRERAAYIHAGKRNGAGGMPVGSGGKALLLLSGGIDSPVAGYMLAKRGLSISAIHFESPPYTSERARLKVERLCEKMAEYCGAIPFICIPFTTLQEEIRKNCPEALFTVIMRRMMMRIAQKIAVKNEALALVTGESVAQVASQTLPAIVCTDAVCEMPVFRPVIGMDKSEIVSIAQKIDTYDISIEPYEDCCTVFTPKHPRTRPDLAMVEQAERAFDFASLIDIAVAGAQTKLIGCDDV